MKEITQGELLLYQDENGSIQIEVRLENENVWLTQAQLVTLYQSSKANVSEHIKHIFEEGELEEKVTVRNFRTVQKNILTVVRKFRTTAVGRVSHQEAIATVEFKKYQVKTLSAVEEDYLKTLKSLEKKLTN
ncbi:hypothetical protein JMN10_10785 [Capnocytophaga genosp. AHN8471]|uniref:Cell filamentation protein Fic n=1 Tax=Capnocytophaga genosp. AHN8471 TaxID=327574 RepID=A0ABS1YXU2_9FLAO|nr:hypothetical protein [Capnocytophaga genosp. AHN8471]MBM0650853.1 hypothetical protein [Capnocytophaga genosp. AHN8471]MBM0662658.1 hypothetical protein [Capnocytophaga genosp. AHN8471]